MKRPPTARAKIARATVGATSLVRAIGGPVSPAVLAYLLDLTIEAAAMQLLRAYRRGELDRHRWHPGTGKRGNTYLYTARRTP